MTTLFGPSLAVAKPGIGAGIAPDAGLRYGRAPNLFLPFNEGGDGAGFSVLGGTQVCGGSAYVSDIAGGNHGLFIGTPSWAVGKFGLCPRFFGSTWIKSLGRTAAGMVSGATTLK